MKALISGQAGLALVMSQPYQLRPLDDEPSAVRSANEALRLFDGCSDVIEFDTDCPKQLDALVEREWAKDRALRLFLLLMDPAEPLDELQEYAECIEELFSTHPEALNFLRNRLFRSKLPVLVEVNRVREACELCAHVGELFQEIIDAQGILKKVESTFNDLDVSLFGGTAPSELYADLIASGLTSSLVRSLVRGEDISFVRLQMSNRHLSCRPAISQWAAMLQKRSPSLRDAIIVPIEVEDEDFDDFDYDRDQARRGSSPSAYQQVRESLFQINELLKARDLGKARLRAQQLIDSQRTDSTKAQIAKSLSNLAQRAKLQEIPELQLEWAEWATRENPADPKTYGHHADALISLGRLSEAERALDACEAAGGRLFAEGGRARILRAMGRYEDARALFLRAAEEFHDHAEVEHAWYGAADTLRDLSRNSEAISEFRSLSNQWPLSSTIWAGLANALLEAGRVDEALRTFGKSTVNGVTSAALNGRARAFKVVGAFREALHAYEEVLLKFPNNATALSGRAEILRLSGKFREALDAYNLAVERAPFSPAPKTGKAENLFEMGHRQEAVALYQEVVEEYTHDDRAIVGLVRARMRMGDLEAALTEVDLRLRDRPYSARLKTVRAQIFQRMANPDAALAAFDAVLFQHPNAARASLGKAAVLLQLNRPREAAPLLPEINPKTQLDWARHTLSALKAHSEGNVGLALGRLRWALRRCPFFIHRRVLRTAIVSIELGRRRWDVARKEVEREPNEVSPVVAFHVYAATNRPASARARFEAMVENGVSAGMVDLATEIGRRHNILDGRPRHSSHWIAAAERAHLLAEAA